ncbi:thymopoietin a isoform X3 [Clarias gariepinus]|uniref:thymopoietin a isoform X3 n=1 Tax=Clarias gariepinus TaxID=13013 RepID=UPI00234CA15C|nr:thymopoietin a isoform X3 [Clarias gariepinus]
MAEFLTDPSVLTKDKLKSALMANNVALPNGEQRKGVYVELYLKNLTSQNKRSGSAEAFSSDEETPAPGAAPVTARSGRKATRKTDRVRPEEIDVTELTNEELKEQLLKYGVSAGPIVASTRKVYEKKLQKLLDQGPPQTTVITVSEPVQTHTTRNGSADSDQYSDKEEETRAAEPEPELEPEPEPVPIVERPLRSRGKTPVTTRTRSSQNKDEGDELEEEDLDAANVKRKSRRSSRRVDHTVPDSVSVSELLPVPRERKRFPAIPKEPKELLAEALPRSFRVSEEGSSESPERRPSSARAPLDYQDGAVSADKFYKRVTVAVKTVGPRHTSPSGQPERKRSESVAALPKASAEEVQLSLLDTALLEVGPQEVLSSRPDHVDSPREFKSLSKHAKPKSSPCSASPQPSRELIHAMCRLSPSRAGQDRGSSSSLSLVESPCRPSRDLPVMKSSSDVQARSCASPSAVQSRIDGFFSPVTPARGQDHGLTDQTPGALIEKLSAVEQTPKTPERDLLKDMFPNEVFNTPTGISATRRQPIKGAAGRPFSETWQDNLRPRLTEHRYTSSSYTETRSAPRLSAVPRLSAAPLSTPLSVPLSVPKLAAPPSVPPKSRRRVPVWVQLLLLSAVAGFLLFVYQAMESNQMSPFGQPGHSEALDTSGK